MSEIKTVSIRFRQQAYRLLKSQTLDLPYVFAEYVDNSLESYYSNKNDLHKANPNYKLKITIYKKEDEIIIIDNAAGIGEKNFKRAFEPGHMPELNDGLNEFGMGLKNSSVWLADHSIVETSALGEPIKRKVEFDYHEVIKKEIEELEVEETFFEPNQSFTKIILTQTRQYSSWPWKKIQDTLASIYRNQLLNDELTLNVFGEELKFQNPQILNAPYQKDYDEFITGKTLISPLPIKWIYNFNVQLSNSKKMSGYVAILEKMSGSGFSYFRRGRVIDGAGDEKQFPKHLSGQTGSPRYKRMYGELHFEGFDVDYKKTGIVQEDEVTLLIEILSQQLRSVNFDGKIYNFLTQAESYRIPSKESIISLTERHQNDAKKRENDPDQLNNIKARVDNVNSRINNAKQEEESTQLVDNAISTDNIIEEKYPIGNDSSLLLRYCFKALPNLDDLYHVQLQNVNAIRRSGHQDEIPHDVQLIVNGWINIESSFYKKNIKILEKSDNSDLIVKLLTVMMLSEAFSKLKGDETESYFRNSFNELIYL